MTVAASGLNRRRRARRVMQVLGLALLLILVAGTRLTASGAFAGGLADTEAGLADAPEITPTSSPTFPPAPTYTPTRTPGPCDPRWSVVGGPNATNYNYLNGVAAVSTNDVWAVGYYYNSTSQTLIEHWDGSQWSVVPSPNVNNTGYLNGVAAVSTNDVWAVGYAGLHTLIEHWDGTSWSVVPSPNVSTLNNYLYGVAVVSANDVWAVGYYVPSPNGGTTWTLIEHWNGVQWSVVSSPNLYGGDDQLVSVSAISSSDVWAVGSYYDGGTGHLQTLVEHWDGSQWSVVPSPNWGPWPSIYNNQLYGVAAVSANDVWAVGYWDGASGPALTMHWDGTSWSLVSGPSGGRLQGVVAISTYDVWAVGYYVAGSFTQTQVEHWNGAWSVVSSPSVPSFSNYLNGVAAVSANDVWAVGYLYDRISTYRTLTEHYATLCGTPTNTPTITQTGTPTNTPTSTTTPTITRTRTPTRTPTDTPTGAPSGTPTDTPTTTPTGTLIPPTDTPTPNGLVSGHLTWQGIGQPDSRNALVTGTLVLCNATAPVTYTFTTDSVGNFALTTTLPDGVYHWFLKGGRHLSNSSPTDGSDLIISAGQATQEFGLQRGGDIVQTGPNFNIVTATDFNSLKAAFGISGERPSDLDYNLAVNVADFNILKLNFGQSGHTLSCP